MPTWAQPIMIPVGGYEFPPYVTVKDGRHEGLTLDLISLFNEKQSKYKFTFVLTSAKRRYDDMKEGRFQIIPFEDKSWGWQEDAVTSTKIFSYGGEVFIANKSKAKDQKYFENLQGKSIKAIQGYHYGFLGFSNSSKVLKDFNVHFTNTQEGNILSVINNRADLAIVTKGYLDIYLTKNPQDREKVLICQKLDQQYQLGILISKKMSHVTTSELNDLINKIHADGSWAAVNKKWGVSTGP